MNITETYIRSNGEKIALSIFKRENITKEEQRLRSCILFIPGTMSNPYVYWNFLEELTNLGHTVIGVHFTGHGMSERTNETFTIYDILRNCIDAYNYVRDNITEFGKEIHIFGHSQGGIVASMMIGKVEGCSSYICGDIIVSNQKCLKNIVHLSKVPDIFIPILKKIILILGKIFPNKKLKFSDYVDVTELPENIIVQNGKRYDDPLTLKEYPLSLVSTLFNISTKNITKAKKGDETKIYNIAVTGDEIFPYSQQVEAFKMVNLKNKKLITIDGNSHMIYTQEPKKMANIIHGIVLGKI